MRKINLLLCILLLFVFIFAFSACKEEALDLNYNGMNFWLIKHETENGEKDYYYIAGNLNNKRVLNYFMPMEIEGIPVRQFCYDRFISGVGTMYLKDLSLEKLYMPGTIIGSGSNFQYLSNIHKDMQVYYCGEIIDLYQICPYNNTYQIDYYVPMDKFDDFDSALSTKTSLKPTTSSLHKANIAYRLNSEDMCEYYYVDNIEAGNKIENIPPEPTRAGYTFGGWYTEKECITAWNFDHAPTVSDNDENFVELALYAKWIKK